MKIIKEYKNTISFIKSQLGKTMFVVTMVFFLMCIVAGYVGYTDSDSALNILAEYKGAIEGLTDSNGNIQFLQLFRNNLFACVVSISIGIIPFIFLPAFSLIANATVIGVILGYGESTGQMNAFKSVVFGMLPHGIFELPAILLSMTMGIYICLCITHKIFGKNKELKLLTLLNEVTRVFVLAIVPLLILAALIECYVTPAILAANM